MKWSRAITLSGRIGMVGLVLAAGTLQAMTKVFDALEATISHRKSGLEYASRSLGVAFEKSRAKSNDFFDVLTANHSRTFPELKSAEIRIDRRSGKIRLILIDVDSGALCMPDDEVMQRFGSSPELSPPTARQPAQSPTYYIYHHPWGDLRIGVSQAGRRCVETIVTEFSD